MEANSSNNKSTSPSKKNSLYVIECGDYSTQIIPSPSNLVINERGTCCIPSRYICTIIGFSSFFLLTTQRLNLSMALVAMVNHTAVYGNADENSDTNECFVTVVQNSSINEEFSQIKKEDGHFAWSLETQANIVSASFLGFVLTQIPGGRVSETLGAKHVLVFCLILASLCNILSPVASEWGAYILLVIQFIKGLAQGLITPAVSCLLASWYPKPEKGFLSAITFSGYPGGNVVAGLLCGILCDSDIFGGWPLVFYVFGFLGIILSFIVYYYSFNSPEEDIRITESEYKYIISNLDTKDGTQRYKTPWIKIGRSVPTWALFVGMFGQYWMTFYFISVHPTYLSAVLHLNNTEIGYLNSLPYIGQMLITWLSSFVSDVLVNKGYSSIDTVRKAANTLSCIGFSFGLMGIVYAGCDRMLNITFFVSAICCVGFGLGGSCIVPLDMTTVYAGTLMGISCTFASSSGFILPLIAGALTNKEQTLSQWSKVLYISSGVGIVSGVIFAVFGSAKVQAWDSPKIDLKTEELRFDASDERLKGVINAAFHMEAENMCESQGQRSKDLDLKSEVIVYQL